MKLFCLIILSAILLCTWPENTSAEVESRIFQFIIPLISGIISSITSIVSHRSLTPENEATVIGNLISLSSKVTELERQMTDTSDTTFAKILEAFPKIVNLELNMHELKLIIDQINYADEKMKKYLALSYSEIKSNQTNVPSPDASNENNSESISNNTESTTDQTALEFSGITAAMESSNITTAVESSNITTAVESSNITAAVESSNITAAVESSNSTTRDVGIDMRIERYTLENFAKWATDHSFNSIMSLLRRLNDLIITKNDDGLFDLILKVSKDSHRNICTLDQSLHQALYNLYNVIMIAELKGNTILQFSYKILHLYNKGNYSDEAKLALNDYKTVAMQKLETARKALSVADRTVYKCDPKEYEDGITYTKLTGLLRGYIENEINLNSQRSCWKTCGFYKKTRHYGCHDRNKLCSRQPACKGKIVNCRTMSSKMQVCFSSKPNRRYDWIKYGYGKILGSGGNVCRRGSFYAKSWLTRYNSRCSYCLCFCDDVHQYSDRYFNLREVTSDIDQNKVVTGLRIVKTNQIIHIQIQQGVLIPHGFINKTSLSWKPVDNYTIHDNNVKNNVDYYTMSLSRRIIDTNEMVGPSGHVVTGLRFRITGKHLNLEARVTPINFTSGELHNDKSFWLGNYKNGVNEKHGISEIELIRPDVPTRKGPHTLISQFYEYVKFQPTSLKYDMGQTTVPFLDSQVLTSYGHPISGIGLIHRGERYSGGFIAPKIISYDFTPHLHLLKTN